MQTIAKIKLAAGSVGWYEPLSRIHLTLSNPIAEIKAGTKLEGIRKSLSYGTIILLEGSINEDDILEALDKQAEKEVPEEVLEVATFKVLEEDKASEELTQEPVQEDAPVEKPKKASKKKS